MKAALAEARLAAAKGEVPVGAVVVCNGEIIARGHNLREHLKDPTAHAEILVLRQAALIQGDWRLNDCDLYVTIEPCPMCAGALIQARIRRLVYGAPDPRAGAVGSCLNLLEMKCFNHQVEVTAGVCAPECALVLQEFFKKLRRE
ncbi:MAG: tRNA-specific adenosine deaminase TadA [Thermoanaerobacterales bacterium 50_218]|nr:MAG: tRNA-specific adenosine deaminase TadA [Thermoanaerobacterales bacterium 50_218]HAA89720.1 tRNA-specific adenosine deaminase [Peptococcaceae bacterium]